MTAVLATMPPSLFPHRDMIRQHLGMIAADEHQGLVEIAWTDADQKSLRRARLFHVSELAEAADFAAELNVTPGVNVYVGAALRRQDADRYRRAGATEVLGTRVLWFDADHDAEAAVEVAMESGAPPSALVNTGAIPSVRMHGYWRLPELLTDHAAITALLKAIAKHLGTDAAVTDPPRVLRLAGCVAWPKKPGRVPELVGYLAADPSPSATLLETLEATFPAALPDHRSSPSKSASVTPSKAPSAIVGRRLLADLRDALTYIEADGYHDWERLGHALKTLGEPGRELWHEWSITSGRYNYDQAERKWAGFKPDRTGYGAVFAEAQRCGWQNPAARADDAQERRSEEELAQAFAHENQAGLRYCAAWGKWLTWDQVKWSVDETLLVTDHARNLCRREAKASGNARVAVVLGKGNTISAVVALARADRRLAATSDQWDADPMLLNTPGGVVDLRTGGVRPCDPALHMTKVTGTAAGGDCPTWLRFLARITGGNAELQAYLQRVFGYALTGETSAHALFFFYGTGANGKSVAINTAAGVLGDYHKTAPIETFTESKNERHSTELAMLRGSRLVTAAETEEGRNWAETKIKTLTGGDRISARFLYRDNFEFTPCFKLIVAGNHKPGLRTVDEAMRRRIHMIPFAVTIPPDERDPELTAKLREEWPGILRWMIDGCQEWQRIGLAPPAAVVAATEAYLVGEDALSAWMEEMCERDPQAWEPSGALFASWKGWAEARGEQGGNNRRLTQALEARGFLQSRTSQARGVAGLRLKKAPEFEERGSA